VVELEKKMEINEKRRVSGLAPKRAALPFHASHTKISKETARVSKFFIGQSFNNSQ